ncbi:hypothetical protein vseg_003423 [Gypsophila vaccaria]
MSETITMKFQTNKGDKLKDAIEAVSKSNTKGMGIMEIDEEDGFRIYALNETNTNVIGYLRLEPRRLTEFICVKPLERKLLNLKFFLRMLRAVDEQSIVFFQEEDPTRISFEAASCPGIILGVGLQESTSKFEAISSTMSPTWEAIIPTEQLKTMIPEMVKNTFTQLVTVDRTSAETKFVIGETEWKFNSNVEASEDGIPESGQKHHVEFLCSRIDSLQKAATLAEQCTFALLPSGDVMFQFQFGEGSIAVIMRPLVLTTN